MRGSSANQARESAKGHEAIESCAHGKHATYRWSSTFRFCISTEIVPDSLHYAPGQSLHRLRSASRCMAKNAGRFLKDCPLHLYYVEAS